METRLRTGGVVLGAVLVLAGVGLVWSALAAADGDLGLQSPRLAPVVISLAWVGIAAAYLMSQFRTTDEEPAERPHWWGPAGVAASLAGFAIALEYAGFVVSAAAFVLVVARVLGSRNLLRDAIVALLLPVAIYFAFTHLLDIFLPAGVLPL
ncbi:tripartite tricarboxylate transporter TctB family protein [Symbioplanes lichenis]|uniref:tripartite tricarboxylate transporter TctB family protein n=1 Tax=Symbioplanes lichenis TaxID=1629072 RepID=UPI002739416E|nr:tripartite tricarboxylate transporter TctB family protein [Actinoplanes lichenis]